MNSYTVDNTLQINATVTVASTGAPVNPTFIYMKITDPLGIITDLSSAIVNPSGGVFYVTYTPSELGVYKYEWIGTGAAEVAAVDKFNIVQGVF